MAPLILSRLFNNRRNNYTFSPDLSESKGWKSPAFSGTQQVRVLLFRECDWRGRKLLFDSKTVQKKEPPKTSPTRTGPKTRTHNSPEGVPPNGTCSFEYLKPSPDVKMLGEMLFGSVAMSFWGTTMKVHTMRSPPQLMISMVFPAPNSTNRLGDVESSGTLQNSASEILIPHFPDKTESSSVAHSVPVDVPGRVNMYRSCYLDSGYTPSDSLRSAASQNSICSYPVSVDSQSSSLTRSGSYNSLQRRWLRNLNTSMECGMPKFCEEPAAYFEPKMGAQRRTKLGLSVVVTFDEQHKTDESTFQEFFFSHIALVEGHVNRLKETVSAAYAHKRHFTNAVHKGVEVFRKSLQDLYTATRVPNPVWLTMVSPSANHHYQCRRFINEFVSLVKEFDTKQTHFFVSTLLTAVLTHHLAWVPTVTPTDEPSCYSYQRRKSALWLDMLARSHPYNPLWMQLGDLYGAIGFPAKIARTLVLGKKRETILRCLYVLTYFMRCSDVYERVQEAQILPNLSSKNIASHDSSNIESSQDSGDTGYKQLDETCNQWCSLPLRKHCTCHKTPPCPSVPNGVVRDNPDNVVFLIGDSPLHGHFSDARTCIDVGEPPDDCTNRDSIGYGSLNDSSPTPCDEVGVALEEDAKVESSQFPSLVILPEVRVEDTGCDAPAEIREEPVLGSKEMLEKTKLYMQEYFNLRFVEGGETPENGAARRCDAEDNPEEGYHSMDDAKCSQNVEDASWTPKDVPRCSYHFVPHGTKELPLPRLLAKDVTVAPSMYSGFGWSLLAGLSDHYMADFCLQGVVGPVSQQTIHSDLLSSVQSSVLGEREPISDAVCIVADTDNWSVRLTSSSRSTCEHVGMSPLVAGICDSVLQMSNLNMSSEFCMMHLEDRLQEIYFRSQVLSSFLCSEKDAAAVDSASRVLGCDLNDVPLILSVATTHSPQLAVFCR